MPPITFDGVHLGHKIFASVYKKSLFFLFNLLLSLCLKDKIEGNFFDWVWWFLLLLLLHACLNHLKQQINPSGQHFSVHLFLGFFLLCIKLALLDWKCTFKNSCFLPLQTQLYLAHWYAQRTWHFCVRGAYSEQTATISTINEGFALRWRRFPSQSLRLWIFYRFGRKVISALLSWVKTSAELLAPKLCVLSSFHTALVQGNTVVLHVGSHCSVTPIPQAHPDRMKGKTSLDCPSRFVFSFPFVSVYSKRTRRKI